jgi:hypothetical protein
MSGGKDDGVTQPSCKKIARIKTSRKISIDGYRNNDSGFPSDVLEGEEKTKGKMAPRRNDHFSVH